jgi:hypothetical protein
MKKSVFWKNWLLAVCLAMILFGTLMVFLSGTPLFNVFNRRIDPAFWGSDQIPAEARLFRSWIYGVWGATIAGWGILLAFVIAGPFSRHEKWAFNGVGFGVLVWYVFDTGLSIVFRVGFNAIFNTVLLAALLLPMIVLRKHFSSTRQDPSRPIHSE